MRDVSRSLDGEHKIRGRVGGPFFETGRALERVEGAVDLDGAERFGGEIQFIFLRELGGIKDAAPGLVAPAGDADANFRCFGHGAENSMQKRGLGAQYLKLSIG